MKNFVVTIREVEKVVSEKEYIVEAECMAEAKEKADEGDFTRNIDSREVNRKWVDSYLIKCKELK